MCNQTINELNNRKLDECLFSIIIIPIKINYKGNKTFSDERELYVFFSCNIHGKRKYLTSVFNEDMHKVSDWYDFILNLKSRGIQIVLYGIIPDNNYLSKALKIAFPDINIFISYLETIKKLRKYVSDTYSSNIFQKVRKLYLSKSAEEFEVNSIRFKESYMVSPFMNDILIIDFKRAKSYYNVEFQFRNFIFSFYFCREFFQKLSVISHSKLYFNTIDEIIEILLPNIQRIETKSFCSKKELNYVINKLYETKKELLKPYL